MFGALGGGEASQREPGGRPTRCYSSVSHSYMRPAATPDTLSHKILEPRPGPLESETRRLHQEAPKVQSAR